MSNETRRDINGDLRRAIQDYQDNYNQYNYNMHEYNKVMTQYMNIVGNIESLNTPLSGLGLRSSPLSRMNTNIRPNYSANSRRFSSRLESEILNYLSSPSFYNSFLNSSDDSPRGLSTSEIARGTRMISFDPSMNETRCPISYVDFQEGEDVCEIIRCGHFFKRNSIMTWFEHNTVCPVCRYDLRENVREYRNSYDASGSPTFTFDFPLYVNIPTSNHSNI